MTERAVRHSLRKMKQNRGWSLTPKNCRHWLGLEREHGARPATAGGPLAVAAAHGSEKAAEPEERVSDEEWNKNSVVCLAQIAEFKKTMMDGDQASE